MNIKIIRPRNKTLRDYVQYFLFIANGLEDQVTYTTFPNNNLCLAIYKNNQVDYRNGDNFNVCAISTGNETPVSRLYGFHKMPFTVNIQSAADQVSVLFRPAALRQFTSESYRDLMSSDNVFDNIFQTGNSGVLEELFEEEDVSQRANLLETLLMKRLAQTNPQTKLSRAFQIVSAGEASQLSVEKITRVMGVDESTLYRMFAKYVGQNPKNYLKTIRFRNALNEVVKNKRTNLTDVAYTNDFFDQSHFIKDFKRFSGLAPKQLSAAASVEQNELIWLIQKN